MAHFFNFSIADSQLLKKQEEVLRKKYDKWRNATEADELQSERKIRAYVLEAIAGFQYKEGQKLSDHPASTVLSRMIGWLDHAGYKVLVDKARTHVRIWSRRNTYVESDIISDTTEYPKCLSGGLLGAIQKGLYEERKEN
jgi:hypothetical protein